MNIKYNIQSIKNAQGNGKTVSLYASMRMHP